MAHPETMEFKGEEITVIWMECYDCGNEYPVGDDGRGASPESAEHHEPDCPVRLAKIRMGQWDDPESG